MRGISRAAMYDGPPCKIIAVNYFPEVRTNETGHVHYKGAQVILDWWSDNGEFVRRSICVSRSRGRQFLRQLRSQYDSN